MNSPIRDKPTSNGSGNSIWQNERVRRVIIYATVFLVVFLLGLVPMWMTAGARERDAAQASLRISSLQNAVANAAIDARRGEYEPARQAASDFFINLQVEVDRGDSVFSEAQRILCDHCLTCATTQSLCLRAAIRPQPTGLLSYTSSTVRRWQTRQDDDVTICRFQVMDCRRTERCLISSLESVLSRRSLRDGRTEGGKIDTDPPVAPRINPTRDHESRGNRSSLSRESSSAGTPVLPPESASLVVNEPRQDHQIKVYCKPGSAIVFLVCGPLIGPRKVLAQQNNNRVHTT